jgi:PadR family transcriptional regulator, regulatory protein AphA
MTSEVNLPKKGRSPLYPRRPATEYALLGLLLDGPGHGYELARQFAADTELGKVCRLEMSMLYGLLKKLEREGLLVGKDEPVTEHKSRRIIELTPVGRAEFEAWLAEPVLHNREIRVSFLVKLYFARQRSPALVLQLLDDQIEFNRALLKKLLTQKQTAAQSQFETWVVDFRLEQTNAALHWLTKCRYEVQDQSLNHLPPG